MVHEGGRRESGKKKEGDVQCAGLGEVNERDPHVFEKTDGYYSRRGRVSRVANDLDLELEETYAVCHPRQRI